MELSGQNPSAQLLQKCHQVRRNGLSEREALVELWWIEDGLDAVSVDGIGSVALDRIRHEVRCELDHPGARVLASLLIEAHGEPLHRLEQCREQETHGSCADHVHSSAGRQGLESCGTGCAGAFASSLEPRIGDARR